MKLTKNLGIGQPVEDGEMLPEGEILQRRLVAYSPSFAFTNMTAIDKRHVSSGRIVAPRSTEMKLTRGGPDRWTTY